MILHSYVKHDNVSHTRMTTFAFILSELFSLDGFRCNFVSAPLDLDSLSKFTY